MVEEWPFKRRDAANTASTTARGPKRDPELRWQYDAGSRIYGTPVVRNGVVYVGTQEVHLDTAAIHAIDAETGEREWTSAEDGFEIRGTPAVVDGYVYAADLDGNRFALSTSDGGSRDIGSFDATPGDGISPLVHEGTMYTNCWRIAARNPSDWSVRWKTDGACFVRPPAVADATVYGAGSRRTGEKIYIGRGESDMPQFVTEASGLVRALDHETGERLWETAIDGLPRTPVSVDGTVYVGTSASDPPGRKMSVIRTGNGEYTIPDEEPAAYREYGVLHAIDAATGDERWSIRLNATVKTAPAVYDGTVCLGAGDSVVAYDAVTGDHRWTFETGDTTVSSPAIADGVVYVGSRDEHLYAIDLYSGGELWRFETDYGVDSNPSVVDGTVYVGDNAGNVYALES